jgi:hypothetical protein
MYNFCVSIRFDVLFVMGATDIEYCVDVLINIYSDIKCLLSFTT